MAIVVDEPIINGPFVEPTRHYRMRNGQAVLMDARRPSGFTPGLRTRGGQGTLLEEEYVELPVVNDVRERVRRWRGSPSCTRRILPTTTRPSTWCRPDYAPRSWAPA